MYGYMSRNEVWLVDHKPNLFEVEKAEKVVKCSYAEKEPVSSIDQAALKSGNVLLVSQHRRHAARLRRDRREAAALAQAAEVAGSAQTQLSTQARSTARAAAGINVG